MKRMTVITSLIISTILVYQIAIAQIGNIYLPIIYGPTPIPTTGPNDITVLPNYGTYVDVVNYLNIHGEIVNNTKSYFNYLEMWIDVQDANHKQLKTFVATFYLDYLAPGDKTCFSARDIVPTGWKYLSFESVDHMVDTSGTPSLSVSDLSSYYVNFGSTYHVTGHVINNETQPINFVKVVTTVYNPVGKVIGCDYNQSGYISLGPGGKDVFDDMFSGGGYTDFSTFRVQASGTFPYK